MSVSDPFAPDPARREAADDVYTREEVALANRNSGALLETLARDITPTGTHYLLTHFDVPLIEPAHYRLSFGGAFEAPLTLDLDEIRSRPEIRMPVTMECAGNGRAQISPRAVSMPWMYEAVGTSEWIGTPLAPLIKEARPGRDVEDIAFIGADEGFDKGVRHSFGRSLTPAELADLDVLLVWGMNDAPLLPQHGAPIRIVVPGWYGMASVKWLTRIEALTERYAGFQQIRTYRFRQSAGDPGTPVTTIRVKSLMVPPGMPDWSSRTRWLRAGPITLRGRAWSGGGVPVTRVEVLLDGRWQEADLEAPLGRYAWRGWSIRWQATEGRHVLCCRATDAEGRTQPLEPLFDLGGFASNAVHRVPVHVAPAENGD